MGGPAWQVPVTLLAAAGAAQLAGLVALAVCAPALARGEWYGPAQLAAAHLLGLGFLSLAIFGALLQLVPVLLRRQLGPTAVMATAGAGLALGAALLAGGLWSGTPVAIACGGTIAVAGLLVLVGAIGVAVAGAHRAGTLGAVGAGLLAAGIWLVVVLAMGAALAADRTWAFLEFDRTRLLASHALMAAGGWGGGTILALALRLAPMFALAHGYRRAPGIAALAGWHAGVLVGATGFIVGSAPVVTAAGGLLVAGACSAGWFTLEVARHRRRRAEAPLVHLALGIASAAAAPLAMAFGRLTNESGRGAAMAALLLVVGLGSGVTSGHLFKGVPMLGWTGRHASRAGTPDAPRLSDLYPARLATIEQVLFTAGLGGLVAGVAAGRPALALAGALTLLGASACVVSAMALCIFTNARPPAVPQRIGEPA